MLDEQDLQAIAVLMDLKMAQTDSKFAQMDSKMTQMDSKLAQLDSKMAQQKKEIIGEMGVMMGTMIQDSERRMMIMMESYFDPKFQALSEQINPVPKEAMDIMEDRVDDLGKTVELHTRQISELKKAQ